MATASSSPQPSILYSLHPVFKLVHSLSSNSLKVDAVPPAAMRAALLCSALFCPVPVLRAVKYYVSGELQLQQPLQGTG